MVQSSEPTAVQEEQAQVRTRAPRKQADRAGKRNVGGQLDVRMARALAVLAAKSDRTQVALLEEAITDLFQKHQHEM